MVVGDFDVLLAVIYRQSKAMQELGDGLGLAGRLDPVRMACSSYCSISNSGIIGLL